MFITVRSPCLLITNATELDRLVRRSRRRPNSSHIDRPRRRVRRRAECARADRTQAHPQAGAHRHTRKPAIGVRSVSKRIIAHTLNMSSREPHGLRVRGIFLSSPPIRPFQKGW